MPIYKFMHKHTKAPPVHTFIMSFSSVDLWGRVVQNDMAQLGRQKGRLLAVILSRRHLLAKVFVGDKTAAAIVGALGQRPIWLQRHAAVIVHDRFCEDTPRREHVPQRVMRCCVAIPRGNDLSDGRLRSLGIPRSLQCEGQL